MINYVAILLLFTCTSKSLSQVTDYLKVRNQIKLYSCESVDSAAVYGTIRNLQILDTSRINKNMHVYYEDLGQCYWLLSNNDTKLEHLKASIHYTQKALVLNPNSTRALWAQSLNFLQLGDCGNAKLLINRYKNLTKKRDWDLVHDKNIANQCD